MDVPGFRDRSVTPSRAGTAVRALVAPPSPSLARPLRLALALLCASPSAGWAEIGEEKSVPHHLEDGQEFVVSLQELLAHGQRLMTAIWTSEEGQGRPLTKGNGNPLVDPGDPLIFPRNMNRISEPAANSCAGCHAQPFGIAGGNGDHVANVFVLGQRFDFVTFDHSDLVPTRGAVDELGRFVTSQSVANSRITLGMFGSGFIEMLARQMTADLQAARDATPPGGSRPLVTKGISFGTISRDSAGNWNTSAVSGIPAPSLQTSGPGNPPSLVLRPFHQAGNVISIRQFTNNAFNHHHGIQSEERFGIGADPDGDGFTNELTRADVTAISVFQAAMAVPGQLIPNDPAVEGAIAAGAQLFDQIHCTSCHVKQLPLTGDGWIFSEPSPYNPPGNLRPADAPPLRVDLTDDRLPQPRLKAVDGVVQVPAFTDLKLHDITSGPNDPNCEPLDMNQPAGSTGFFAGNCKFITRKLWGTGNAPPFFHHGKFTTLREAVLAHDGEAKSQRLAFEALSRDQKNALIEFLKSLQTLKPDTRFLVVDERYRKKGGLAAIEAHGDETLAGEPAATQDVTLEE